MLIEPTLRSDLLAGRVAIVTGGSPLSDYVTGQVVAVNGGARGGMS